MAQERKGLDKWSHLYMRWCVDTARDILDLPDEDKSDDIFDFWRYDNDNGWIPVKKDKGYIWGHILGTLIPIIAIGLCALVLL